MEALYKTGTAPAREYAQATASKTQLRFEELVPQDEGYLAQIANAAHQLLSGTTPLPIS